MKNIAADKNCIAFCGLYCGACKRYLNGKCPGCRENEKATWCGIRQCCAGNGYASCADCREFTDVNECKKFNNAISKIFGFIFRSNRKACVEMIRKNGYEVFAAEMAGKGLQSIRR